MIKSFPKAINEWALKKKEAETYKIDPSTVDKQIRN